MAQERFLILGASSFYGRNFAQYVREQGDFVEETTRVHYDIDDKPHRIALDVECCKPDYIVNFISRSLVAESWVTPQDWVYTNTHQMTYIFDLLERTRLFKKFIHVSTPESYGHTPDWIDETYSTWEPSTPYGVSRAAADMMLMAYNRVRGFPAVITRTANIYGPGQGAYRIIPLAFDAMRAGETLLLHGGGQTVRSFIHVRDACAATYLIAKKGVSGETYHISTREAVSIKDLCDRIGVRTGSQPERLGKDHAYLLKSDKVRALGWTDTITLKQGLEEYGQHILESR